jgi:hypothetical protein
MRPVDFLQMLAWKSTSPLPMPCQPVVLTGGIKYKNKSEHVILFLHKHVR